MNPLPWLTKLGRAILKQLDSALDAFIDFIEPDPNARPSPKFEDRLDDPDYHRFVDLATRHCQCDNPPCEACLAGGICDCAGSDRHPSPDAAAP